MKELVSICILLFFSFATFAQTELSLEEYLKENNIKTQSTPENIHYLFTQKGKGATVQTGKFVKINYRATFLDGTAFDASPKDAPFVFEVGYQQVIRGLDRGIQLFQKGSQGTLYIPSELGYGTQGKGNSIPKNADLIYEIEVLDIMDYTAYDQYIRELEEKEKEAFSLQQKTQFEKDKQQIKEYAATNNLKIITLPSGVSYIITKRGKGVNAKKKNLIEVNYEGFLADGSRFEEEGRKDFKFWLGRGMVIEGWEEALRYFNEGAEGIILCPSKFAYGPRAIVEKGVNLPANSVLIFDIKLSKILRREE